jgi:hypothetical protein
MTLLDFGKVKAGIDPRAAAGHTHICLDCDGKGCEECGDTGMMKLRRCSDCHQWLPAENFYGQTKKQSRCIPCYKAAYGFHYRKSLRESRRAND